ncbi:MAG: transcription elongation factor GreA [Ruminococcaceae bacterium]|nr:transcription elongation factor GreA [Oscillospiraceae bacterium]
MSIKYDNLVKGREIKVGEKVMILTYEGLKKLEDELDYLKTEKRKEIAETIKVARGFGDLSENAEYDEAKKEQAEVEIRIVKLEKMLQNTELLNDSDISTNSVSIGSKVTVYDELFEEEEEFTILSSIEADPKKNIISDESSMGKALMGAKVGDKVRVKAPNGEFEMKVLRICKYND